MNILSLFTLGLTLYLLIDNLTKINYDFSKFVNSLNLINYLYIIFFHFYYNEYVLFCILITSMKLALDIISEHPMYNLLDDQNDIYIFGAVIWYLLFNFIRECLNLISLII